MSDDQFLAWLQRAAAVRMVLIEAQVNVAGVEVTRYIASRLYTTGPADTPANIEYLPLATGGLAFTEQVSLTGEAGLSGGDIELDNADGALDGWLVDVWSQSADPRLGRRPSLAARRFPPGVRRHHRRRGRVGPRIDQPGAARQAAAPEYADHRGQAGRCHAEQGRSVAGAVRRVPQRFAAGHQPGHAGIRISRRRRVDCRGARQRQTGGGHDRQQRRPLQT